MQNEQRSEMSKIAPRETHNDTKTATGSRQRELIKKGG
jgi:hypothetical protein